MRLLLITPMPPDREGAGAIPVLLHAELVGLQSRHEVTLVTVAGPDRAELEAVHHLRHRGVDVHAAVRPLTTRRTLGWRRRMRIVGTWLRGRVPFRTAWFAEPEIQSTIDALFRERRFDAIVVEDNAMATFQLPRAIPAVLSEHEVRRPRQTARPPRAPSAWARWAFAEADWRRWAGYEQRVWPRFQALQVFTRRDAAAVESLVPEMAGRVHVNPFPIELAELKGVAEEPDTLLFAGNYSHPPNVDAAAWLARDVFPRVAQLHPKARLTIAGPYAPPEVQALEAPGVSVVGYVPDLDALLQRTAVVMAPVRTGGGMRMKVLHAMALGKPVVTTARGAEGLGAEEAPPLELAEGPDGLAQAAVRLLQSAPARRDLGGRARYYVGTHHSPGAYVDRLEGILAHLRPHAAVDGSR